MAPMTLSQHLPADFEEKLSNFRNFTKEKMAEHCIGPQDAINMDEVPLTFNLFTRTMNKEDESSLTVKTTLPGVASGVCQVLRNHHTTRSGFFKI